MKDLIVEFDLDPLQDLLDTLDWTSPQLQCVAHVPQVSAPSPAQSIPSSSAEPLQQDIQLVASPTSPVSPGKNFTFVSMVLFCFFDCAVHCCPHMPQHFFILFSYLELRDEIRLKTMCAQV